MADDQLASELAAYRDFFTAERSREEQGTWLVGHARRKGETLLAAVEAALDLARTFEKSGSLHGEPLHLVHVERRACGKDIREAITRALTGGHDGD
jgi:hypothetical protein